MRYRCPEAVFGNDVDAGTVKAADRAGTRRAGPGHGATRGKRPAVSYDVQAPVDGDRKPANAKARGAGRGSEAWNGSAGA